MVWLKKNIFLCIANPSTVSELVIHIYVQVYVFHMCTSIRFSSRSENKRHIMQVSELVNISIYLGVQTKMKIIQVFLGANMNKINVTQQ